MKILIVSDTHRKNDNYLKVLQMVGPLDMVVHCGDAEGSEDVLKEEMFGCHPCENTSSIRFKTRDLMEKILPALNITPTIVHLVGTECKQ